MRLFFPIIGLILFLGSSNFLFAQKPNNSSEKISYDFTDTLEKPMIDTWNLNDETLVKNKVMPKVLYKELPSFPEITRRLKIEGDTKVKVFVDTLGKVCKAEIWRSDLESFEKPTMDAALKWLFSPFLVNGSPHKFTAMLLFKFRLVNGQPLIIPPE